MAGTETHSVYVVAPYPLSSTSHTSNILQCYQPTWLKSLRVLVEPRLYRRFRHYTHALQVDNISIYQLGLTKRLVFLMYFCTDAATAKPAVSFKL